MKGLEQSRLISCVDEFPFETGSWAVVILNSS